MHSVVCCHNVGLHCVISYIRAITFGQTALIESTDAGVRCIPAQSKHQSTLVANEDKANINYHRRATNTKTQEMQDRARTGFFIGL